MWLALCIPGLLQGLTCEQMMIFRFWVFLAHGNINGLFKRLRWSQVNLPKQLWRKGETQFSHFCTPVKLGWGCTGSDITVIDLSVTLLFICRFDRNSRWLVTPDTLLAFSNELEWWENCVFRQNHWIKLKGFQSLTLSETERDRDFFFFLTCSSETSPQTGTLLSAWLSVRKSHQSPILTTHSLLNSSLAKL